MPAAGCAANSLEVLHVTITEGCALPVVALAKVNAAMDEVALMSVIIADSSTAVFELDWEQPVNSPAPPHGTPPLDVTDSVARSSTCVVAGV